MPWREAGLTAEQAAALLLDRFAFGARPGEVERVAAEGPDVWFERQLAASAPEPDLARRLAPYESLTLSEDELLAKYPPRTLLLREARDAGVVPAALPAKSAGASAARGAAPATDTEPPVDLDRKELRDRLYDFARRRGYRSEREALADLLSQKVLRGVYAENQVREVLTDFWFNHFNVALSKNQARPFVMTYERDAIRPHVLGGFRDLLEATAKHPAMLLYLDNARSTAAEGAPTTLATEMADRRGARGFFGARRRMDGGQSGPSGAAAGRRRSQGINENYARELMELHTLGVDGGYSQQDVSEVARAFSGWTVLPPRALRRNVEARLERALRAGVGFVVEGDFLFRADAHDDGPKTVLGHRLPAGRGVEDGEAVLDLLAGAPATARHLAQQLATRFVSDEPPAALVDRLAKVYLASGGDLRAMVRTIAEAPEFWAQAGRRQKIKSPFELAVSALRATGAEVSDPLDTVRWIARMGQPLYAYQAPTGWPDRAAQWVNSGALLNRMNFGLQLAAGRINGVTLDLTRLDGGREPESAEAALRTYGGLLLPGRDPGETASRLAPLLRDPSLADRVVRASPRPASTDAAGGDAMTDPSDASKEFFSDRPLRERPGERGDRRPSKGGWGMLGGEVGAPARRDPPTPLEQVVGLLIGSPEFQRR